MRKYSNFNAPSGVNLRSDGWVSADNLARVLKSTVAFLQSIEPPGQPLYRYADWWEHDGLHFNEGEIDFSQLAVLVENAAAVRASMSREYEVFVGIASQDFRWYLRFYHEWDYHGREEWGRFDITLPNDLIVPYRQQVLVSLSIAVQEQESVPYYLSIGMDSYT